MSKLPESNVSLEDLLAGFTSTGTYFQCLFCGERRRHGRIYQHGSHLVDAKLAMEHHITEAHQSTFQGLLEMGKPGSGLSEVQLNLLGHMYAGLTDKEIQPLAGNVSLSTIRNHRFQLRTKARQAKVLLAIMELLEQRGENPRQNFIEIPGRKAADDERFAITLEEYDKIIQSYFPEGPDGPMKGMPKKEKRKVAVLIHILKRFDPQQRFDQHQVNTILRTVSADHTTLCRYLVDYGFLGRTRDGSTYWVE
jgi:hypothetical protein